MVVEDNIPGPGRSHSREEVNVVVCTSYLATYIYNLLTSSRIKQGQATYLS